MKNILLIMSAAIIIILVIDGCQCNCESDCEDIACTEVFVTITVTVVDGDQNPFILDDYKVINLDTNKDISIDLNDYYQSYPYDGVYPIFDDRFQQDYQNQEVELQFIGYIDNRELINEYYLVGADCCHVYSINGNYNMIIE